MQMKTCPNCGATGCKEFSKGWGIGFFDFENKIIQIKTKCEAAGITQGRNDLNSAADEEFQYNQ